MSPFRAIDVEDATFFAGAVLVCIFVLNLLEPWVGSVPVAGLDVQEQTDAEEPVEPSPPDKPVIGLAGS